MKVSGFTFIRNGQSLGFPFIQSVRSILPICDEFIINVGHSTDETLDLVRAIDSPKIKIIQSQWNDHMVQRGFVYGEQKMIAQYSCSGEWLFYLEGDEVIHEDDLDTIYQSMQQHRHNPAVEALAFDYLHFYGNTATYLWSPAWYRQEARIIKASVRSYAPDGLFWVVLDRKNKKGRYPRAATTGASIYHYGWVRSEQQMQNKIQQVQQYWSTTYPEEMRYENVDARILRLFTGSHPKIMADFFPPADHLFQANPSYQPNRRERKNYRFLMLEKWLGLDFSKRHFKWAKID